MSNVHDLDPDFDPVRIQNPDPHKNQIDPKHCK